MTLFHYLQLQEVEPEDASSALDYFERDEMRLDEDIDARSLEHFLSDAVDDLHSDANWQPFYSDDE